MDKLLASVATQNHDWIKDLILTILDIVDDTTVSTKIKTEKKG